MGLVLLGACGGRAHDPESDAGPDAGSEPDHDAGPDAAPDAGCELVEPDGWRITIVDEGPPAGSGPSPLGLVVDDGGVAHVAFARGERRDLVLATQDDDRFALDAPGADGVLGMYLALEGDADVVVYHDGGSPRAARRDAAGWTDERLGVDHGIAAMALGPGAGELQLCVERGDWPRDYLHLSRDAEGTWTTSMLAETVAAGKDWARPSCAMAVSADGTVHAAYGHGSSGTVWHGVFGAEGWSTVQIEDARAEVVSLAVEPDGTAHVAYAADGSLASPEGGLLVATGHDDEWSIDLVDSEAPFARRTSLAVDSTSTVHVAYAGPGVRYAARRDGTWAVEILDEGRAEMPDALVAVGPDGAPHVLYTDSAARLVHATRSPRECR